MAQPSATPHAPRPAAAPRHAPAAAGAAHEDAREATGATGAIALAVVLALGLALWLFKEQGRAPAPSNTAAPAALQPVPRAVEPKFSIHLKNDAWLRVMVDGQMAFEGRVPRGARQEWKPNKFVSLRTTEPAALELELNGTPIPLTSPLSDGEYRIDIP